MNPTPGIRPSWVDDRLFPFESRFVEIGGHTLHYVDEGEGPVLLLLHGNPAWSFLYRHVIAGLRDGYRCVAVDLPGFGLSTAEDGFSFLPADHSAVVERFTAHLGLDRITMMVQDWAGPIGLGMAGRDPARFERLVVGNTWAWPVGDDRHFTRFSGLFGGRAGRFLIRRFNLFVNALVPRGHARTKPSKAEMAHYRKPFPTQESRVPTSIFPREIVHSAGYLAEVEAGLAALAHLPVLILWGGKDIAFRQKEKARFEAVFPTHHTVDLPDAGHYLQDDAPDEVVAAMREWLAG
ncbi:MAG: alpha/beta fold hydrolase [Actinobacteria bacterium]|nr:alpha/beta fold hydrolase [Actinomycetota bacterium]